MTPLLVLSGCGTMGDALMPGANYDRMAAAFRGSVETGSPSAMARQVNRTQNRARGADRILYLQEHGRMLSLAGDWDTSIALFQEASDQFDAERMRPELSLAAGFFGASSLALNDLAIPYRGKSHEIIMAHNFLAMDHLRHGNLELARFALNRADLAQSYARTRNQRLNDAAEREAHARRISIDSARASVDGGLPRSAVPHDPRNAFQNAFTFYLSAVLFELLGDPNRALIEYRRALEILPSNRVMAQAAHDLAVREQDQPILQFLRREHPWLAQTEPPPADAATVVVVFEQGWVNLREEFRIPFPWRDQILQVAVPFMRDSAPPARPLLIQAHNKPATVSTSATAPAPLRTELAADINLMATAALREMLPAIYLRQALRLIAKYQSAREAGRQDPLLGFGVNIFNILTDKADLRAWSTLPANIQIAHFHLPAGEQSIKLSHGNFNRDLQLELPTASTTFIFVTIAGSTAFVHHQIFPPTRPPQPTRFESNPVNL